MRIDPSAQGTRGQTHLEGNAPELERVSIGCLMHGLKRSTVSIEFPQVDVGRCETHQWALGGVAMNLQPRADPLGLGQDCTVLSDQAVGTENQIGGALGRTSACVGVSGDALARLHRNELLAVLGFPDRLVACRKVQQDVCPSDRLLAARRDRDPKIFANLDP